MSFELSDSYTECLIIILNVFYAECSLSKQGDVSTEFTEYWVLFMLSYVNTEYRVG